jgi:hypothetical protein
MRRVIGQRALNAHRARRVGFRHRARDKVKTKVSLEMSQSVEYAADFRGESATTKGGVFRYT